MKIINLSKKVTAFLFTFVLLVSMLPMEIMAVTAPLPIIEDGEGSLTIIKTDDMQVPLEGVEYTIYKVATIEQSQPSSGSVTISYKPVAELTDNAFNGTITASTSADIFDDYLTFLTPADLGSSNENGEINFLELELGIYLVVETDSPDNVVTTNNFLVSIPMSVISTAGTTTWNYNIVAEPKNTVIDTTIDKKITSGARLNSTNVTGSDPLKPDGYYSASRGDVIAYQIDVLLPSNFNGTNITYQLFDITDEYPNVLAIDTDDIVVKLGGTLLTVDMDYEVTPVIGSSTGYNSFTVSLIPDSINLVATAGKTLTITYNAAFTTAALVNTPYKNEVQTDFTYTYEDGNGEYIVVSTDPTNTGADVTVDPVEPINDEPTVVTYSYTLTKVDGDNSNAPLAGAIFVIQDSAGNYLTYDDSAGWISNQTTTINTASTVTSGGDGIVTFPGLAEGTYTITEKVAPAGYSLLKAPITVYINRNTTGTSTAAISQLNVVNSLKNFWELPATGGLGIYIFTIGGVILIAAAIILLSKNRKKNNG